MEQTAKERTLAFMAEHAGDPTPMELFHMHVKHVGINTKSEDEAWEVAETLARLLGLMPPDGKYEGGEPRNLRPYWLWRK